jgi:hypothetical protein
VTRPAHIAPGEIAVGVVIGRASEYFDFFVYGIASVLVFPAVFFPFERPLERHALSFAIFALRLHRAPFGTILFMASSALRPRSQADAGAVPARHLHRRHRLPAWLCRTRPHRHRAAGVLPHRPGPGAGRLLGRPAVAAGAERAGQARLVRHAGPAGRALGFIIASGAVRLLYGSLSSEGLPGLGLALSLLRGLCDQRGGLFARLRLVVTHEYARLLEERELDPTGVASCCARRAATW